MVMWIRMLAKGLSSVILIRFERMYDDSIKIWRELCQ